MPPKAGGHSPPQPGTQSLGSPQNSQLSPRPGSPTTFVAIPPQTSVVVVQNFDSFPVRIKCPYCFADVTTVTHAKSGTFSWIMCVILCLIGCHLGCCLIPFCSECCQDVIHTCPQCGQQVGKWNRL